MTKKTEKTKPLPKWERDALMTQQDLHHFWGYNPRDQREVVEETKIQLRAMRQRVRRLETTRNRLHKELYGVPYGTK